jgi:hypothetical protein
VASTLVLGPGARPVRLPLGAAGRALAPLCGRWRHYSVTRGKALLAGLSEGGVVAEDGFEPPTHGL